MKLTIEIDKDVLLRALSQTSHNRIMLSREYTLVKEKWLESIDIDGITSAARPKLTVSREKIEESSLGPKEANGPAPK